jgi:hypothetical protein
VDDAYTEIPFDKFNKDMLLVSRIAKISHLGVLLNAGTKTNEQLIRPVTNSIHLKSISYSSVADEALPINVSVQTTTTPVNHEFQD